MASLFRNHKNMRGFTLLELAIVIIVAGLLLAGGLYGLKASRSKDQWDVTAARMTQIETALSVHIDRFGHLPCPAPFNAAMDTAGYAQPVAACAAAAPGIQFATGTAGGPVAIGALPTRALNLPDEYGADGRGGVLTYAVSALMAADAASYQANDGAIQFSSRNTAGVVQPLTQNAIYAVVSHGPDRRGAGGVGCAAGALDGENCDGDAQFLIMPDGYSTQGGAQNYDDRVVFSDKQSVTNSPIRRYIIDYMACNPDTATPPAPLNAHGQGCATATAAGNEISTSDPAAGGRLLYSRTITSATNGEAIIRATIPVRYDNTRMGTSATRWERAILAGVYVDGEERMIADLINPGRVVLDTSGGSGTVIARAPITAGTDYTINIYLYTFNNTAVTQRSLWAGTIRLDDYDVRGVVEVMESGVE